MGFRLSTAPPTTFGCSSAPTPPARAHAFLGAIDEAIASATRAAELAATTDAFHAQAHAQFALAEVLKVAGGLHDALAAAEEARRLWAILGRPLEVRRTVALAEQIKKELQSSTLAAAGGGSDVVFGVRP